MRYPDGGGLTPAARAKREQVRMRAGELFAAGLAPAQVAKQLRVSRKSAYTWHRAWQQGGLEALGSKGPSGSSCRLTEQQVALLEYAWTPVRPLMAGARTSGGLSPG
ncbi:helix-turn-helix domain-containing protein [Nonomuraea sp. NPDC049725]|uniref:helix-turn-helix domain-containing protein n=1 Tax=Nonomuraea sp. NPDC049725 TaxID=3154508 RepID=UPI003433F3C0